MLKSINTYDKINLPNNILTIRKRGAIMKKGAGQSIKVLSILFFILAIIGAVSLASVSISVAVASFISILVIVLILNGIGEICCHLEAIYDVLKEMKDSNSNN